MVRKAKTVEESALASLARREHSVAELRQKLLTKKFGHDEVEALLAKLVEKRLLSDSRYAEVRARTRATGSKWGETRIKQELGRAGVDKALVKQTMEDLGEQHDWLETARGLLARKYATPLPDRVPTDGALGRVEALKELQQERARRIGFLTRRGFSLPQALEALRLSELDMADEAEA